MTPDEKLLSCTYEFLYENNQNQGGLKTHVSNLNDFKLTSFSRRPMKALFPRVFRQKTLWWKFFQPPRKYNN